MVNTNLDQIRAEAVKTAISYGLDPNTFAVVWDEGPATAGPKYAIPDEIKAQGTPQHISFWSRTIENSAHPSKPKNVSELDQFIKDYLHRQTELGYAHLFPTPDADGLAKRYAKIREATLEEAIEFPPEWLQIRVIPHGELERHIKKSCHQLTVKRDETLKEGADYLLTEMKAGTYKPAEVADLLATCAKFRINPQGVVQKIGSDNEHMPHLLTGALASRIIGKMREGMNTKGALQKSIQEITQISKNRHGNFTGWKKYDQSKEKKKAEELNADLATTNWCTGGDIKTAQDQLSGGNFYVYFEQGDPQIAIRTEDNKVAEIRGRGQGQALTTQTIRTEAENFLTSGKGPTGGENYLWDQKFRRACLKFNNTGDMGNILKAGFDQTGEWIGAEPKAGGYGQNEFEEGYIEKIKQVILPKNKVEKIDPDGSVHLFTSYDYKRETPCNLDYTSIAGNLNANNATKFHAPNLTHTGGVLWARYARKFHTPNLTHTGGDLRADSATDFQAPYLTHTGGGLYAKSATDFHAPNITHTGGDLYADSATEFHAPNLTHTGGDLNAESARGFYAPNLTHTGGDLCANSATEINLPNLTHTAGDLYAESATDFHTPKLTHTDGDLGAYSATEFHASNLTHTGGDLWAVSATEIHLPKLTHTGGNLYAKSATEFCAPNLEKIGSNPNYIYGELQIGAATTVDIPKLFYVEGEITHHPNITLPVVLQKEQTKHSISPKGTWQAKIDSNNQITLNAAIITPDQVQGRINHELAHAAYRDPKVKKALTQLWNHLPNPKKKEINKILKAHYPSKTHQEEAKVRAFEILTKDAPISLIEKFFEALENILNRITNSKSLPDDQVKSLTATILAEGIKTIQKSQVKKLEYQMA